MRKVKTRKAENQLSRRVKDAFKGKPARVKRLGFLNGQVHVPEDFERMGRAKIAKLFGGGQ